MAASIRCLISFLTILLIAGSGNSADVIEPKTGGLIDWTEGIVTAVGIGVPPEEPSGIAGASEVKAQVLASAHYNARRNLFDLLTAVRIDTNTLVKDMASRTPQVEAKLREMAAEADEVDAASEPVTEGTISVRLQMSLYAGFAQMVLPQGIIPIDAVKSVQTPSTVAGETLKQVIFTGLVVDARNITANPALAPRIVDENEQEVYGAAFASRDFAVQYGMSSYVTDIDEIEGSYRLGQRPLIVKGIKTIGPGHSDIVIGNASAVKLRKFSEHLAFLRECRVVIVLGEKR
ncbi:MAG: hypothetical protein WCE56_21680 [Desulfobacterales bacterium]